MLLLETKSGSSRTFLSSALIHAALIAALLSIRFAPDVMEARPWHVAMLAPARITNPHPYLTPERPMPRAFHLPAAAVRPAAAKVVMDAPVIEMPRNAAPVLETPKLAASAPAILEDARVIPVSAPKPVVQAAGFSAARDVAPSMRAHATATPTGAFETAESSREATSRVVRKSGFSEAPVNAAASVKRTISSGGFGDASVSVHTGVARNAAPAALSAPVDIQFKPKPAYTDEARRLRIEGEVELEIAFEASGKLEILRVVRGLGHGLDESAIAAARAMRFHPAQAGGRAVDSTAIVHIVFQLAY